VDPVIKSAGQLSLLTVESMAPVRIAACDSVQISGRESTALALQALSTSGMSGGIEDITPLRNAAQTDNLSGTPTRQGAQGSPVALFWQKKLC